MGQMRSDADRGSLVRGMNRISYAFASDDDFNVALANRAALEALIASGASMTLLSRAPMVPGTLAFTVAHNAGPNTRAVFEIEGYDQFGHEISEVFVHDALNGVRQTAHGYMWIKAIRVKSIAADVLSARVGHVSGFGSSNPGAGWIVPGRPSSKSEFEVFNGTAILAPISGDGFNRSRGLFYPTLTTSGTVTFVVHPDVC